MVLIARKDNCNAAHIDYTVYTVYTVYRYSALYSHCDTDSGTVHDRLYSSITEDMPHQEIVMTVFKTKLRSEKLEKKSLLLQ